VRYSINKQQVTFRVLDEGAVVVNCETGYYYTLNATGTFLWELLDERDMTLEELTAALARAYEQDENSLVADVERHLDELRREDLVVAT
jgi:PqqD family protein of HPr-rel-A system